MDGNIYIYNMGLSEISVPLHPMVLLIIIPTFYGYNWGYTPFSDIPIYVSFITYGLNRLFYTLGSYSPSSAHR